MNASTTTGLYIVCCRPNCIIIPGRFVANTSASQELMKIVEFCDSDRCSVNASTVGSRQDMPEFSVPMLDTMGPGSLKTENWGKGPGSLKTEELFALVEPGGDYYLNGFRQP